MKALIVEKHRAHKNKDKAKLKSVKQSLNELITQSKLEYKQKVESKFEALDSKGMWQGLRSMAGMTKKPIDINIDKGKELEYVNELNKFYARFDNHDFSQQIQTCFSNVDNSVPSFDIEPFEVFKHFCK